MLISLSNILVAITFDGELWKVDKENVSKNSCYMKKKYLYVSKVWAFGFLDCSAFWFLPWPLGFLNLSPSTPHPLFPLSSAHFDSWLRLLLPIFLPLTFLSSPLPTSSLVPFITLHSFKSF